MSIKNVVVVPIYKLSLNNFECVSLAQCFRVFKNHKIIMVKPHRLAVSSLLKKFAFSEVVSFENDYFDTIHGYNALMLSAEFYAKFLNYNFMLIYQPDAFVFTDQLDQWSNSGYDYIGAPWLRPLKHNNPANRLLFNLKRYLFIKFNITKNGLPKSKQFYNSVGNGGFSIRNISKFHSICISHQQLANKYVQLKNLAFNEDLFWSIEVNRKKKLLNIPNYKVALQFSIETFPFMAFELNNHKLPFGCHAWEKHLDFWKEKIENEGYLL